MSVFDFDRMGFFKIPLGLTREEFQKKQQDLKNTPVSAVLQTKETELRRQLKELDKTKAQLLEKMVGATVAIGQQVESKLNKLAQEEQQIRNAIYDIKYQRHCPDLTSPAETRKILDKIETEVLKELKLIAAKNDYKLVLNNSVTAPVVYPLKYESGELFGHGVPGIDFSLFYAFLANKDHLLPGDDTPETRKLLNWLELINYPHALNQLPIKPYPLVLSGGDDLTMLLVKRIYKKHKIEQKVLDSVVAVLEIMARHSQTFDSEFESLVGPK
jgi:hypothetical protein